MSYTINLTNGSLLSTVSDGTIDITSSSLTLIGRDYSGYGAFLNENFVKMLENFSNTSSPPSPLKGQLWWDSTNNVLRVWSGTSWKISTGATSSGTAPTDLSALGGDLWFDTINQQLKVYTGTGFLVVGPPSTPATGNTGTFPVLMTDTSSGTHVVIQFIIAGTIYAVFSKDTFSTTLPGFTNIVPGLNFNLSVAQTLGLNTQSASALPSTLVLRDSASGITGAAINGTVVTASTVNAGSLNGTFNGTLNGNVSATTVSATTMTSQVFTALSGFTGTLLTPSQTNITGLGNITNLNTNGTTTLSGTTNINGSGYYNGSPIATIGGSASFSSINNTPIGNITPSTGAFTTLAGTLTTAVQPNLTTALTLANIGTVTAGTWHANVISPTYGGTGVNNGSNTLTLSGSYTLNQSVASGAAPTLTGTNFSSIPNGALTNNSITVTAGTGLTGGGTVALGGSVTVSLAGSGAVTSLSAGTGVSLSGSTGAVTVSIGQAVGTGNSPTFAGLTVNGSINATGDITSNYSDDRLKTRVSKIDNALDKVLSLTGFIYEPNEIAQGLGYEVRRDVGISAQDAKRILPELTAPAPIDPQYLTVKYDRLSALLVEAIKELKGQIDDIKSILATK